MATVIDDVTGEEVEVVPVEAVAAIATVSTLSQRELPPDAAKRIEQAMVWAINKCNEEGVTDPEIVRGAMMLARDQIKKHMRMQMEDLRSQEAAAAREG